VLVNSASRPEYIPGQISDPNYVRIFDTTLRDGEQSPGATLTSNEKLDIAKKLTALGVDIIEAGFPIASNDDFNAVSRIAKEVGNTVDDTGYSPVICGLSRAAKRDIEVAWDAVRHARRPRVHTFIATSEIHMKDKLRMTQDEVVAKAIEAVSFAKSLGCEDIEFSPEDAGRSDPEFLYRVLGAVIEAGATTLNIPDTTGWCLPNEFGGLIAMLRENTPGADKVVFSTHCQNDLGLSTANSLAGVANGARQVECTINGIGERAGNASLEEVVMAIAMKGDTQLGGAYTGISPIHITSTSRMVAQYSGMVVQPHKAIVGANAFQHESGIHQDGMLKSKATYEIMSPETIGLSREDDAGIALGKHSGRHAVRTRMTSLGLQFTTNEEFDSFFDRFKTVAERRKGGVADEDMEALYNDGFGVAGGERQDKSWHLQDVQVVCGTMGLPTATVRMVGPDGVERIESCVGTGPVDAAYKAVDRIVRVGTILTQYDVSSVTDGIDALATTTIALKRSGSLGEEEGSRSGTRSFRGAGSDTDIVVSSVRAYVHALNKLIAVISSERRKNGASTEAEEDTSEAPREAAAAA